MADFEMNGASYRTRRFPPKMQMKILKRLARIAPALKDAGSVAAKLRSSTKPNPDGKPVEPPSFDQLADALTPVAMALADMPDDDVEFIIDNCLHVTDRKAPQAPKFTPIMQTFGVLMFQPDGELIPSLTIAFHVLQDNFASIFGAMPTFGSAATAQDAG